MRKRTGFLLFAMALMLSANTVNAQAERAREQILKGTNVEKLLQISKDAQLQYNANKQKALEMAKEKGWIVKKETDRGLIELQGVTENGKPLYYITHNADAAVSVSTDKVYSGGSLGLNLDGTDMIAGEWDGGDVLTTHQEFNNTGTSRVIDKDGVSSTHYHATHVGGTIIAGGVEAAAKGMAYNASLHAYDWNNDESEMAAAAAAGLIISNHSYGYGAGWSWNGSSWSWLGDENISTEEDFQFGFYSSLTASIDNVAKNAPYYLIVKSAGNDRGDGAGEPGHPQDGGADGYDCISYKGNAKNILTVGATLDVSGGYTGNPADVEMTSFSSWGPADDGRIKPDISGNGYNLYSSYDGYDSEYNSISGTSMSAPNVTGSLLLLQEHYGETHSGGIMKAATLKALAIHTADEAGPHDGPDYMFGWGLLNTATAADVISNDNITSFIKEETIANGTTFTLDITAMGTEPLEVTIVWADLPGTPVPDQLDPTDIMLVNDLDMTVSKGATTHFPWKLDGQNPAYAATTGVNDVDNVENIFIANPETGTYTISITHKGTLTGGSQDFSMIVSGVSNGYAIVATNPVENITLTTADLSGEIIDENGSSVTERGFVYSTTGTPTTADSKIVVGSGMGTYSTTLSDLYSATKYYVRAYAINDDGTAYGQTEIFTTLCGIISNLPFSADFADGLPTCWENIDNNGSGQIWQFNNPDGRNFQSTTVANGFAILDSDHYGSGNSQDADLITPTLDFTNYSSVNLTFEHTYRNYTGSSATISYSTDGGINWTEIQTWTGSNEGTLTSPAIFNEDLSAAIAGQSNVRIKWNYAASWAYYWAIDDIEITGVYGDAYTLTFNVQDENENPIENAVIEINSNTLTTNAAGVATILLPENSFNYTVSKLGFQPATGTVTISGADASINVTLIAVDPIVFDTETINNSCFDDLHGSITINNVTGGIASGFRYSIDAGTSFQASSTFVNLSANTYFVVVKDGAGNLSETIPIVISEPDEVVATIDYTNVTVFGANDGEIEIAASGGDAAYEYSNDNGVTWQQANVFTNLIVGEYLVVVRDGNLCTSAMESITITEPAQVFYTVTFTAQSSSAPVENLSIHITDDADTDITIVTDVDGSATTDLPSGDYVFSAQLEGFEDYTSSFTVIDDDVSIGLSITGMHNKITDEVHVYPNPTSGLLTIDVPHVQHVEIVDLSGKTVFSEIVSTEKQIDVSDIDNGIYLIKIQTTTTTIIQQIIVKK